MCAAAGYFRRRDRRERCGGCETSGVPDSDPASRYRRPYGLAVFLIVAGAIGLWAAFMLTMDKIRILEDPFAQLSCSFSVLIGCAKNLGSWEGSLFGFPNPVFGLAAWSAVIAAGASILAAGRLARWWWLAFAAGTVVALGLVVFFITASLTDLRVLCPWCMVTWAVTIPTFWGVTLYTIGEGHLPVPPRVQRTARTLYGWVPLITVACYAVVAVLAQLQLDWIHRAF